MANLAITGLTETTAPVDADLVEIVKDVATTPVNKKITWANIKAALKTYFDSLSTTLTNKTLTSPLFQGSVDGWISANETHTYASANTVNVPAGAASKYAVGDRYKCTQTTVKYFVITVVADALLTFAVNTDYVVANAAITLNYYSHQASPIGYPTWFTFAATWTGFSSAPASAQKFCVIGKMCTMAVIGANGTSNGSQMIINLPITNAVNQGLGTPVRCSAIDNNAEINAGYTIYGGALYFTKNYSGTAYDQNQWTATGVKGIYSVTISYEI